MEDFQNLLERAAKICLSVHAEQRDRQGNAFFLHPFRVALKCESDEEKIVALLHDVVEDGYIDKNFLLKQNFPINIVEAVFCLRHRTEEDYKDYIKRLAPNSLARVVKIKELEDNLNLQTLKKIKEEDLEFYNNLLIALHYLKGYNVERRNCGAAKEKPVKSMPLNLSSSVERTDSLFYLDGTEWKGLGQLTSDGKIIILKDSLLRLNVTNAYSRRKFREDVIEQYCEKEEGGYRLKSDLPPMSPSASSGLVLGRSSNGKEEWKDASGRPLSAYLDNFD